jgi:hypothetical protein
LSSTRPDPKESREARDEIPVEAEDIEAETVEGVADTKEGKHYPDLWQERDNRILMSLGLYSCYCFSGQVQFRTNNASTL